MSFTERVRNYWNRVAGQRCQYEFYDDKNGWQQCHNKADHVHHIIPEGVTKHKGGNPDESVAMPLCKNHHVRYLNDEPHDFNSSFHPDIGQAYKSYGEWKSNKEHMESISGRRITRKEYPSPFEDAVQKHREKAKKGERYHTGTDETDQYYVDKMRNKATMYNAETGEKRPSTKRKKEHKKPRNRWWWSKDLYD